MGVWRAIVCVAAFMWMTSGPVQADPHKPTLPVPEISDDGMHAQSWFYKSDLDLRKDLVATEKGGKRLLLLWEQKDCSYCTRMHQVNLRIPRVVEKISKGFNIVRLNIWGDRKLTDLDGSVLAEKDLAEKNEVAFTPTLQFLPESLEKASGKAGRDVEVFRSEGYFKPFHFYFVLHYVQTRGYESEPNFQRWLGSIGRGLSENNISYDLWADELPAKLPDKY
jgi:thioredoxin-related protein